MSHFRCATPLAQGSGSVGDPLRSAKVCSSTAYPWITVSYVWQILPNVHKAQILLKKNIY